MGYYTEYELRVQSCGKNYDRKYEQLMDKIDHLIKPWNVLTEFDGDSWYGCDKWYSHVEDMCALSKEFPDVLFRLDGTGETYDDVWREFVMNGKHQYCRGRIVYEKYDAQKLVPYGNDGGGISL